MCTWPTLWVIIPGSCWNRTKSVFQMQKWGKRWFQTQTSWKKLVATELHCEKYKIKEGGRERFPEWQNKKLYHPSPSSALFWACMTKKLGSHFPPAFSLRLVYFMKDRLPTFLIHPAPWHRTLWQSNMVKKIVFPFFFQPHKIDFIRKFVTLLFILYLKYDNVEK